MAHALIHSNIKSLPLIKRGKVRDVYSLNGDLLIITTDRLSVFDVVLPKPIPDKGAILNTLSAMWFSLTNEIVDNHLITSQFSNINLPDDVAKELEEYSDRFMLVKKTNPLPIECIVRGYLTGSGLLDYKKTGTVCGIKLPSGLTEASKLSEPIFTPSTKAPDGEHDLNITEAEAINLIGSEAYNFVKEKSIAIYNFGAKYALDKGIIIADTKMEFGYYKDNIILIDELLTPDSSRFWPADTYSPGNIQASLDKQPVRDYYSLIGWNKKAPAPNIPLNIITSTTRRYKEIHKRLTN